MKENFVKLGGPCLKKSRVIMTQDAHGRIILANCHTRRIDGKMEIYRSPDCGYLSIYYPVCLDNIRRLLREDEKENDRIFNLAKDALGQIEIGQDWLKKTLQTSMAGGGTALGEDEP